MIDDPSGNCAESREELFGGLSVARLEIPRLQIVQVRRVFLSARGPQRREQLLVGHGFEPNAVALRHGRELLHLNRVLSADSAGSAYQRYSSPH